MKRKQTVIVAVLLIFAIMFYFVVRIFDPFRDQVKQYPSGLGDYPNTGNYMINPETVIASLNRGETNVFMPEIATPQVYTSMFEDSAPPPWNQSDYEKIVGALHRFVWNETLDDWNLERLTLGVNCRYYSLGFAFGHFVYFKTVWVSGTIEYTAREMLLHPLEKEVSWGGGTNFPHPILGWKSVNLNKIKINAEDALRIADENGGKSVRSSLQDNCAIYVSLSGYTGWHVSYEEDNGLIGFDISIDPYTGKLIK